MDEIDKQQLATKLSAVMESGVGLFIEGKPATPEMIAQKCVCEDMVYMADYVLDETGRLKELRYDRVTDW